MADTDADGKMNIIEFSIACKLISAKLKGVQEVPKVIPPTLLASLQHIGTPIRTPTGAMSPTESYKQFLTQQPAAPVPMQAPVPQVQPMIQAQVQPTMMMQNQQPPVMMMNQGITAPQPMMIPQQQPQMIPQQMMPVAPIQHPAQQMIPQQIVQPQMQAIPQTQEMIYQPQQTVIPATIPQVQPQMYAAPPIVPPQPVKVPLIEQLSSGSLLDNLTQAQPSAVVAPSSALPAAPTPTPPQSGHASRSMSFSEKAPSIPESP